MLSQGHRPVEVAQMVEVGRRSVRRCKAAVRERGRQTLRAKPPPVGPARRAKPLLCSRWTEIYGREPGRLVFPLIYGPACGSSNSSSRTGESIAKSAESGAIDSWSNYIYRIVFSADAAWPEVLVLVIALRAGTGGKICKRFWVASSRLPLLTVLTADLAPQGQMLPFAYPRSSLVCGSS